MRKEDTKYYLTIFKFEGHERYRAFLGRKESSFDDIKEHDNWPEVTEQRTIQIDRITGELMINNI